MKALLIIDGKDVQFTWITGKDCLAQRVKNRILLFSGEWIHRPNSGINWYSVLGKKNIPITEYENLVKSELAKDSEVISIQNMTVTFANTTEKAKELQTPIRSAIINYTINSIYGTLTGVVGL